MADGQKLYGEVTLDALKSKAVLATDADGVVIEGTFPAEADTLQTVLARGNTATTSILMGGTATLDFTAVDDFVSPFAKQLLTFNNYSIGATEFGLAGGVKSGFQKANTGTGNVAFYTMVTDAAARSVFGCGYDGDAYRRWRVLSDGQILWGSGAAGQDVNLYRSGANALKTDDAFSCAGLTSTAGVAAGGAITGATSLNTLSTGIFGITATTANSGVDITGSRPTIITTFTGATHKARTGSMGTGAQNFLTMNAAFDGANWNSDDTSLPVVVFDISTANPGMRLRYAAAGVGAKTLLTAMQMSTAGVMQIPKLSPIADSTTAQVFFKADGTTAVMTIDTTNSRLGVGVTPAAKLHVLDTKTALTGNAWATQNFLDWTPSSAEGTYSGSAQQAGTYKHGTYNVTTSIRGSRVFFENDGSGTITDAVGQQVYMSQQGTGTITNAKGFEVMAPAGTSVTKVMTNVYGVYINTITRTGITNPWGIYQAGTSDLNYFGGNTGFGTTAPSAKLHSLATTEQLRLGYDASNYFSTTVGSTGGVTFDAVGAGAGFTFSDSITLSTKDIITDTTTGTKIGTATGQKLGFWNATPVVQQAHIADASGGLVVDTEARAAIASINALLATLGLTAAA
jgi:hypothetical protein